MLHWKKTIREKKHSVACALVVAFFVIGPGAGAISANETNCTDLVDDAYTLVYQSAGDFAVVASNLDQYRDRLLDCAITPVDGEQAYLIGLMDYLQGQVAQTRGDQQLAEEKFVSVIDQMESLIEEGRETSGTLTLLADAYVARAEYRGKFYGMRIIRDVRQLLEKAVDLNPLDGRAHLALARYYLNAPSALGGDIIQAREHAEIAWHSNREVVKFDALILLSDIYRELGAVSESDDAIVQAAQIFPSNEKVKKRQKN